MADTAPITLAQLNRRIAKLIDDQTTHDVWITAELSDVTVSRGHCYMELLQKDEDTGSQIVARARGIIWASLYPRLSAEFTSATGQRFATGIKVMLKVTAQYHPIYGMSLNISAINPEYTMGDLLRRRREMVARLQKEGILNLNRNLPWPDFPGRVALISAPTAAGFGDFCKHLYTNPAKLRFSVDFFPAIMQGTQSAPSIVEALYKIGEEADRWDCVVITRGGGSTSDLHAFEDYDLAATIAQFPIPVIIGLGHDRDVTLLDYVANTRVITPTDAAQTLINKGLEILGLISDLAAGIHRTAADLIAGAKEQLSYIEAKLPIAPGNAIANARNRLNRSLLVLSGISGRRISPALARLDHIADRLRELPLRAIRTNARHLDESERLLEALSPMAVLRRGYTITRIDGHAITSTQSITPGQAIETIFADGSITSIVKE